MTVKSISQKYSCTFTYLYKFSIMFFMVFFFGLQAKVLAVLDWELSTTGQPLADLAYFLMPNYCPSHLNITTVLGGVTGIDGRLSFSLVSMI